ncbi:hypothetical protein PRIPAC_83390 [Pristionchus pacificus]|uniref:Uncharacterized protein n=1 Tax=Pristionchus pacificus TaxID=54126 RepID=A0A2A6BGU2_PRIPA|nr:hypothetical protein PRIPAC_83390 [Pristionchus pacificus]|eukprot:PDM65102.1 hypothetical protein PRIPAC_53351 [Pristionchus pacificus]
MCVITCCGGKRCCGCCSLLTCCFPIRGCTYTFVFTSFLLQLAMCIFFLIFEAWYSFVAVGFVLGFHIYFILISRGQRFCLLHLFTTYESLWSLVYVLLFIWSIVLEIWPDSWSPFWNYYFYLQGMEYYDAESNVSNVVWVLMISSACCAIIQSYTSRLLFAYKKWLELQAVRNRLHRHQSSHAAPHVTVINTPVYTIQPPPTAPYQPPPMSPPPPPPPPPSAMAMQGPVPGTALLPPPSAHVLPTAPPVSPVPTPDQGRRMYPEVPMPSSSSHLEAPPPYAAAVAEGAAKGGAYENFAYENKY